MRYSFFDISIVKKCAPNIHSMHSKSVVILEVHLSHINKTTY